MNEKKLKEDSRPESIVEINQHKKLWLYPTHLFFLGIYLLCLFYINLSSLQATFEPHPWNQTEGRKCEVALCCVFKNEADWLREWIEFHRLIGIDHFYLYNNVSTDHYLDVLTPYLLAGTVEIFNFSETPLQTHHQKEIYNHAIHLAKGLSEWLAIIDTDEFIVPLETQNLVSYLKSFPAHVGGIEINWQTFGTSGVQQLKPNELLIEKLILKAPYYAAINTWAKSIVRPHAVTWCVSSHHCLYHPEFTCLRVTPCCEAYPAVPENEAAVSKIRIHHYIYRTEEYFYKVKYPRIFQWDANFFQVNSPLDYLPITNSVLDFSMFPFISALKKRMFLNENEIQIVK